ncbi:MAG: PilZ domain-containing protein [Deltaproteobacteria bacterium]|nr:PilZ domain-containing protein [Deltaproteobacteria bacterium]
MEHEQTGDNDQRRTPRVRMDVEFKAREGHGGGTLQFRAADLSLGGAFLRAALLLEEGETLSLEFRLPGSHRLLKATARVAWVRRFPAGGQPAGMGMEFLSMSPEDREVLGRHLALTARTGPSSPE